MAPLKICDLTQSFAATGGGVRTYLDAKRNYILERTDHEHLLIVPGATDSIVRDGRTTTCTVESRLVPGSSIYRLLLRSDKVLRLLEAERPDIVECQCSYNLPWTAFYYRRRNRSARVVGAYCTDVPVAYIQPVARRVLGRAGGTRMRRLADGYIRRLYKHFDAAVAISPALAERLAEMGIPDVHLVPLGVDLETFHPSRRDPEVRARFGIEENGVMMIYCGRLDSEKRASLLVEAFDRLPPESGVTLVLIGDGPQRAKLLKRAEKRKRLHVLPFESDRVRLATILASADVYVSAMPFETFGLSVVEAQACGLPVVGVAGGAMRDRVPPEEGVGLLGPVDDVEALSHNMLKIARNPHRAEAGRRARVLVENEFSWSQTFDRMLDLYNEIL